VVNVVADGDDQAERLGVVDVIPRF